MDTSEFMDTIKSRFESPLYFSISLAFIALNWRAMFLLFLHDGSALQRIELFDDNTNILSLFVLPIFIGVMIACVSPFVRIFLVFATSWPLRFKKIHDVRESFEVEKEQKILRQKSLELDRRYAAKSQELGKIVSAIENPTVKKGVEKSLESVWAQSLSDEHGPAPTRVPGYEWLIQNSVGSFDEAKQQARKENKKLFVVFHDQSAHQYGNIRWAANAFFKFQDLRDELNDGFVVYHTSKNKGDLDVSVFGDLSVEEPCYALYSFDEKLNEVGRLYPNSDEALKIVRRLKASY